MADPNNEEEIDPKEPGPRGSHYSRDLSDDAAGRNTGEEAEMDDEPTPHPPRPHKS